MLKSQVAISVSGHKEKLFVPCFHDGEAGIAYHHPFNEKRSWQFTHIKSGLGLGIFAKNLDQARRIFNRLSLLDWGFEDLSKHSPKEVGQLRKAVTDLKEEYGLHHRNR